MKSANATPSPAMVTIPPAPPEPSSCCAPLTVTVLCVAEDAADVLVAVLELPPPPPVAVLVELFLPPPLPPVAVAVELLPPLPPLPVAVASAPVAVSDLVCTPLVLVLDSLEELES